ncbi:MAG: FAD-dependent oxidoreductase [Oscillospiraceae bacterium]|jgi:flavin-dependent dehydrogenase|nr:FAD-dependent oxidoreductase [Oscillospiraceae bacterium]
MSTFLIAGAGHGGLAAALRLARAGHGVTVLERSPEAALGYDWTDVVEPGIFAMNGFTQPDESVFTRACWNTIIGPSKRAPIRPPWKFCREMHIERKLLLRLLIADCRAAGVAFEFEVSITGPLTRGRRVVGLKAERGEYRADMVIDAAGAFSPVRSNMPEDTLVDRELLPRQVYYAWRGLFERNPGPDPDDLNKTYLMHMGRKSMSWCITEDAYMDVFTGMVGRPLAPEELESALADLRSSNPLLGGKLLRGGQVGAVPVRRPFAAFVADGYAAVGDSAAMADPFGGSGINLAMNAGKLLADVILQDQTGQYSAEHLWNYQRAFFTWSPPSDIPESTGAKNAVEKCATEAMKTALLSMPPEHIDLLFTRGIINFEMAFLGKPLSNLDALKIFARNLHHMPLLVRLVKMVLAQEQIKKAAAAIPETYDRAAVMAWKEKYNAFDRKEF